MAVYISTASSVSGITSNRQDDIQLERFAGIMENPAIPGWRRSLIPSVLIGWSIVRNISNSKNAEGDECV